MNKVHHIKLALILGSGIELSEDLFIDKEIITEDNSGIHNKQVFTCSCNSERILVFKGRKHFYEGFSREEITGNIDIAARYGAKNLLITNAAGGLNENFNAGDLMLIRSHINFLNRIRPEPVSKFYDAELQNIFRNCCSMMKIRLNEGTYGCYSGPTYETRAEVRFQKNMMIDAAGMSTIPEVLHASRKGIKVIAVSVITNLLKENKMIHNSHEDVLATAFTASINLNTVLPHFISELN